MSSTKSGINRSRATTLTFFQSILVKYFMKLISRTQMQTMIKHILCRWWCFPPAKARLLGPFWNLSGQSLRLFIQTVKLDYVFLTWLLASLQQPTSQRSSNTTTCVQGNNRGDSVAAVDFAVVNTLNWQQHSVSAEHFISSNNSPIFRGLIGNHLNYGRKLDSVQVLTVDIGAWKEPIAESLRDDEIRCDSNPIDRARYEKINLTSCKILNSKL